MIRYRWYGNHFIRVKNKYDDCIKIFEFYIDNIAILVSLKSQFKNSFYLTGERGTFSLYLIINRIEIDYKNYQIIESNWNDLLKVKVEKAKQLFLTNYVWSMK